MEARKPPEGMTASDQQRLAEVIARARMGSLEAWGELYRDFAGPIFRFCRRALPAREDAEDATTEIFMKLREKLGQYDSSRPFQAWLYKVSANHCWDLLRRRRIRQDLETEGVEELPLAHPEPSQLEKLVEQRTSLEVRDALAKLPARSRMALVLRYYSDMSYDEIAEALGIRRNFVGVVLLRARHQLREVLAGPSLTAGKHQAGVAAGGS
jgi:RNA polymerase sigma-70 factor, ECF subfamily